MQLHAIKNKLIDIFESYFILVGDKMGYMKDEDLTDQVNHRKRMCEGCLLRRGNWCSRRQEVVTIEKRTKLIRNIKGCACWLPAKFYSLLKYDSCPLDRWQK